MDVSELDVLARHDRGEDRGGHGGGLDQGFPVHVPGEHRGVGGAGVDGRDPHPVLLLLDAQTVGERAQGVLARGVGGVAGPSRGAGPGVHEHDGAAGAAQGRQGMAHQLRPGGDVEGEHPGPALGPGVLDPSVGGDASGVHERIDPLGDEGGEVILEQIRGARGDQLGGLCELGQCLLVAADGDHPPARRGELPGHLAADPAGGAGDEGGEGAVLGGVHGSSLPPGTVSGERPR